MGEWRRVRLGDICDIVKGETGLASATPGPYPLVATSAERRSCSSYQFDTDAVCIPLVSSTGHGKKTLNYVHYQAGKFALGTILAAVIPKNPQILTARYLHLYLSHFKDTVLIPLMKGAANVSLPIKGIASLTIPVPPVDEQRKLIDLIGRIEDEHRELLEEGDHQAELLKQLRQIVLQEAIEGKLTADWRKQHPVVKGDSQFDGTALLAQIKAEKERLIKEGRIRKEKPLLPIAEKNKPFELPEGWVWCRLGAVSLNKDDARIPISQNERERRGKVYPYYGASGIIDKIDGFTHEGENLLVGEDGANLVARSTPVAFIAAGKYWVNNHAHVLGFIDENTLRYLEKFVNATDLTPYITGGFQPKLSQANLLSIRVPFPPLAEQQAIVARVDSLMAMVEELEQQVSERKEQAQRLMQAVLREAFAGGGEDGVVGFDDEADEIEAPKDRVRRKTVQEVKPIESSASQPATQGNITQAILTTMQPGQVYSRADLLVATGIAEADWTWAIRQLKDDGLVVQEGEKRGARYRKN